MATKQRKNIGYYVPKEHIADVKPLLADYDKLNQQYTTLSTEYSFLDQEYSRAIEAFQQNRSEETDSFRLEAQKKWHEKGLQERAVWVEKCTLAYTLRIIYDVIV